TITADGCESGQTTEAGDTPVIRVDMDSVVSVLAGYWGRVPVSLTTPAGIAEVIFLPDQDIAYASGEVRVYGRDNRTYEVTFVDAAGCADVHTLRVRVTGVGGVYT